MHGPLEGEDQPGYLNGMGPRTDVVIVSSVEGVGHVRLVIGAVAAYAVPTVGEVDVGGDPPGPGCYPGTRRASPAGHRVQGCPSSVDLGRPYAIARKRLGAVGERLRVGQLQRYLVTFLEETFPVTNHDRMDEKVLEFHKKHPFLNISEGIFSYFGCFNYVIIFPFMLNYKIIRLYKSERFIIKG
jgi:hypothetical protein